jgi:hypothetical protein
MNSIKLFHISEEPNIKIFIPRPSPSEIKGVKGDVVFAITEKLLHNYLLPRDCPRVTYFAKPGSLQSDIERFFGQTTAEFVIAVENNWYQIIQNTTLYCYEFSPENFSAVDEGAGYYVSYEAENPVKVRKLINPVSELLKRNVELRFTPKLWLLADQIIKSSLQYSLIRMRNALPR